MLGNKRWTIAATFAVIATILSLAACAAPTPQVVEKEVVVEKPVVETVVIEKEVVVTPTPVAIKPATIRVSMTQVGSRIPFWENLVKTFMDKYPDIKVKMEGAPPEEFYLKLLAQFAAGDPPDIMQLELDKFPSFAERGVLMNLGPLMEKHNFDAEAFFAEDLARSTYQGEQVLIPDNVEAGALLMRTPLSKSG
jgi:ABC-type glycerol-3-phosphate transport system substrate-binding protein